MKTIEEFLRNIFSEANWDYGELEEFDSEFDSDITDTIKEKTKLFIQEAIKADRINLLNYVEIDDYDEHGQYSPSINKESLINALNIKLL